MQNKRNGQVVIIGDAVSLLDHWFDDLRDEVTLTCPECGESCVASG